MKILFCLTIYPGACSQKANWKVFPHVLLVLISDFSHIICRCRQFFARREVYVCVRHDKYEEQSNTIIVKYSFGCDWAKTIGAVSATEVINYRYTYRPGRYIANNWTAWKMRTKKNSTILHFQFIRDPISGVSEKRVSMFGCRSSVRAAWKITTLRRALISP